jgi:hypothetical protein
VIGTMDLGAAPVREHRTPALIDQLLRDRDAIVARIVAGKDLMEITRTMIVTIAIAMAIVGAALGSSRGGIQIGYAAIKLPLVLIGTAALSAPALTAIGAALGRRSKLTADLALVITALAYGALLMSACTPLILLARALDLSYHQMILATVSMFAVAGCMSLRMVTRALAAEHNPGRNAALLGLCVVFALVGGQLSWSLRPYLLRPRTPEVPFLRETEGSLLDAVTGAIRSARGIYTRDSAPLGD